MSLSLKKITTVSFTAVILLILLVQVAAARVYVYEVTTAATRFQTASKLPPDAFLYYNGGYDIIYDLKVVATYPDEKMAQALKDYNLEENNSNSFVHNPVPRNIPKKPYYWWR